MEALSQILGCYILKGNNQCIMVIAGMVILSAFSLLGFYSEKKIIINPITVFCGLWAVILLFSALEYYTMYAAKGETYLMIIVGSLSYIAGYYFNKYLINNFHIKIGKCSRNIIDKNYKAVPRYTMLYGLTILCITFYVFDFINVVRQSGLVSLGTVQALLQSGEYDNKYNAIMSAILILVVSPVSFAVPAIAAVDFWFGKRDRKLLAFTGVLLVARILSSANRTSFILFFIYLILAAILFTYHNKCVDGQIINTKSKVRKLRKNIIHIAVIGVIAFVLMTMSRGSNIFRNLYLNFAMPPRMFEIWAEDIEYSGVIGYGAASLLGFIYPVCYLIKNLLRFETLPSLIQDMFDWTMRTDTQWVWPGKKILANAYVSVFWFLYTDGRLIGIIIGMFIFGIVVSRSYQNVVAKRYSARQVAVYCLIFYGILYSFVRFQFTLYKYALALVFVMFIAYKMIPSEREESE